jgi:hypothetical protein
VLVPDVNTSPDAPEWVLSDDLNRNCTCLQLDATRLRDQLEHDPSLSGLSDRIAIAQPHLFSNNVVFVSEATHQAITQAVDSVERVVALPAYQATALARAPAIAQHALGPHGVFMGYDFHVETSSASAINPKLIEINTNAGGALLSAALARSHPPCCDAMQLAIQPNAAHGALDALEQTFFNMFQQEWKLQRGSVTLNTVAIVDDAPTAQYLAPEFALVRQMFAQRGVQAVIADARELQLINGHLRHGEMSIDLVYNRLTDFDLSHPGHQALHQAYVDGTAVITPHPHAHALRANKRNLIALSNDERLRTWGVTDEDRQVLRRTVPATHAVTRENSDALWAQRRQLFFKPVSGYGGKAAYRGDKLTRRVWEDILSGDFIAQALVPPGQRVVLIEGVPTHLKYDIRAYTYNARIQLLVARTYSGQTTNFRTPGGGFAPVLVLPSRQTP